MAITVADNFQYKGGKPLDARMKFSSVSDMVTTSTSDLYDGCFAYVTATKKYYSFDSSNEVDETLGKWREYASGSEYSEGDGIDITNDVISVDAMPSADMAEIVTPLPGVMSRMPILFDETGAERVIGWYKYSNGTKKPVYEKIISKTLSVPTDKTQATNDIDVTDLSIDKLIKIETLASGSNFTRYATDIWGSDSEYIFETFYQDNSKNIRISTNRSTFNGITAYVSIRYTKTTDTAS